jgi:hypothetical protein
MRYYILLALISLAAYAAASAAAAMTAAAAWPVVRRRGHAAPASARARAFAAARLLPAAAGAAFAAVLSAAFIRYEPVDTTENPGLLLVAAALLMLGTMAVSITRMMRGVRAASECTRLLRFCGRPVVRDDGTRVWIVDTPYPVAAVTGVIRTRLLLSRRLIEGCSPAELDAIVRHESAHVSRRDNLVRAAMLYLPDPLWFSGTGREMMDGWAAAAEEAADDQAAGQQLEARTALASALIRVAGMAGAPAPRWMPALAFYQGTNLEHRVRRLLDSSGTSTGISVRGVLVLLALTAGWALALTGPAARELHAWMEVAVRVVP